MVKRQHLVWRNYLSQWTDDINSINGNLSFQYFITGDCSVINLIADYNLKEENLKKLELFYPITPKLAIIYKNTIKNNTIKTIHDVNEIDKLNNKMYEAATKQVYACEKKDLNKYIT